MIKEAIDRILELAKDEAVEVDGLKYWSKTGYPVEHKPPSMSSMGELLSLQGIVSAITGDLIGHAESGELRIIVDGPAKVRVELAADPKWGNRDEMVRAVYKNTGFRFGVYHDLEEFIIGVQCQFVGTPDRAELIAFASSVTGEEILTNTDDGVSQTVSVKEGFRKDTKVARPIWDLSPYRTFPEAGQPVSKFLLRMQKGANGPRLALFEADGGQWQATACRMIASWLKADPDIKRLNIPVIG